MENKFTNQSRAGMVFERKVFENRERVREWGL